MKKRSLSGCFYWIFFLYNPELVVFAPYSTDLMTFFSLLPFVPFFLFMNSLESFRVNVEMKKAGRLKHLIKTGFSHK